MLTLENAINTITHFSYENINNELKEIVRLKVKLLYSNFQQLKPKHRTARSLEILGTAWKWIGGSPDADDLRIINTTMNELTENNNKQYRINKQFDHRLRTLTDTINQLTKEREQVMLNELETIKTIMNIDIINHVLEEIQEAISWTKVSVVSNKILSSPEINSIKTILEDQGVKVELPDEALKLVQPIIAINSNSILYILKIPQLADEEATMLEVFPLSIDNRIIVETPTHLIKTRNKVFKPAKPDEYIQNQYREYIDKCTSNLILGRKSDCSTARKNNTTIKLISDGLIIVDNAKGAALSSSCGPDDKLVSGNLLIRFNDCEVTIMNQTFSSKTISSTVEPYWGAVSITEVRWQHHKPMIRQDAFENIGTMQHSYLQQFNSAWNWNLLGGVLVSTIFTLSLAIFVFTFYKRSIRTIADVLPKIADA